MLNISSIVACKVCMHSFMVEYLFDLIIIQLNINNEIVFFQTDFL